MKKMFVCDDSKCQDCIFQIDFFSNFDEIRLVRLKEVLTSINNKFCSLDPVPSWLIKDCFDELGPIILQIINKSLSCGLFLEQFKDSVVKPTIKESKGEINENSNYRPVSNLPYVSKILEKVVSKQLNTYLERNDLYCDKQSGYRSYHSCNIEY